MERVVTDHCVLHEDLLAGLYVMAFISSNGGCYCAGGRSERKKNKRRERWWEKEKGKTFLSGQSEREVSVQPLAPSPVEQVVPPSYFSHNNSVFYVKTYSKFLMSCSCLWCCYRCWEHALTGEGAMQLVRCWVFCKCINESCSVNQKLQPNAEIREGEKEGVILPSVAIASLGNLPWQQYQGLQV